MNITETYKVPQWAMGQPHESQAPAIFMQLKTKNSNGEMYIFFLTLKNTSMHFLLFINAC